VAPRDAEVDAPRTEEVPPDPPAMIESMRAFGYSLPDAIADLVDNSITAAASLVEITLHWDGADSWIRIVDDGLGMDAATLTNAMRLGSRNPKERRDPNDLGRFGLGLKTAAFSQAAALTVVSRAAGSGLELRSWDLEHISRTGSWSLLFEETAGDGPALEVVGADALGTAVLLKRLDRLVGEADVEDEEAKGHFLRLSEGVERHLGIVFHRFLESGLTIRVNGRPLQAWDPFLASVSATQVLPAERLPFAGESVEVQPYVLPHHSHLSAEAHRAAAGTRGWNQHQGFYVYRARRLLVAGDWLGLPFQKEEHYKLARIRVDLSNAMDREWQIDVRKATARIPRELRNELKRIADATRSRAAEAYRYRGKRIARQANVDRSFVWSARVNRGTVEYRIDREHPLIAQALAEAGDGRGALERTLRVVEETLPVQAIVMEAREHPDGDREPFVGHEREVDRMLREALEILVEHGARPGDALTRLAAMEPFDSHPELIATLAEEVEA
jgi:Histidine kinase-, DNA gyrase B-, and HSP90-like ATPase